MSANPSPDESAKSNTRREQARRKKRKDIVRRTLIFLSILLICVGICGGILFKGVMDWDEEMRKPVTYTMPAAAQIIDQYASPMDFFGDFEYCAAFRVSDIEYNRLLQNGFDWIYIGQGSTTPAPPSAPYWQDGGASGSNSSAGCFAHLTIKLNCSTNCRNLFERGDDWEKLLAIDEKEKIIFYYRNSW